MKTRIFTELANKPAGPYSQGIVANGLLFVAGQLPKVPSTGQVVSGGIREQTAVALGNLLAVAAEAGCTGADAVRIGVFLADFSRDFAGFNEVYTPLFAEPEPARTTVQVALSGILVEVDGVFLLPDEMARMT
jgi:2-iminobutanoate/2-iminopropanoate deaminase